MTESPKIVRAAQRLASALALSLLILLLGASPAHAATTLTAEIVSWQIVGLDSNQPASSEPELFIVQAQLTNTGAEAATLTTATLALGPQTPTATACGGACITIASSPTYSIGTLAPGGTADAFWTVRISKTSDAFEIEVPVTVTVSASNAPSVVATQAARTGLCNPDTPGGILRVENLISQNRNFVRSYTVSPGIQRPDGSWEVTVGSVFTVVVQAHTATDYQEISVPAIADPTGRIIPVTTSFEYENGTTDDDVYQQGAGGEVTATYSYRASVVGSLDLSQLIYDCSGNSYHYNTDYSINSITIHVVGGPEVAITKSVLPTGQVAPGQTLTFTINYQNTGSGSATNFVITDDVDPSLTNVLPSQGGTYDPSTRRITWTIGTLAGGASGSVSFTAVISDFAGGRTFANVALGDADQFDPTPSNSLTVSVLRTTPATGSETPLLLILGLASIGLGHALSGRKFQPQH